MYLLVGGGTGGLPAADRTWYAVRRRGVPQAMPGYPAVPQFAPATGYTRWLYVEWIAIGNGNGA